MGSRRHGAGREPGGAPGAVDDCAQCPWAGTERRTCMGPLPRGGSRGGPAYPCAASQVYRGYVDDPRNTDNAWIETVAISIHFSDQSNMDLKRLNSVWAWAAGSRVGGGGRCRRVSSGGPLGPPGGVCLASQGAGAGQDQRSGAAESRGLREALGEARGHQQVAGWGPSDGTPWGRLVPTPSWG